MLISTEDDSLVFANELRKLDKWSEPDLPETSEIFGSPKPSNEPTQIDQDNILKETQLIEHGDYPIDSSNGGFSCGSDRIAKVATYDEEMTNNGIHDTQIDSKTQIDLPAQQDPDISEYSRLTINEEESAAEDSTQGVEILAPLGETQVIEVPLLGISSSPQKAVENEVGLMDDIDHHSPKEIDNYKVYLPKNTNSEVNTGISDTQIINIFSFDNLDDTQKIMSQPLVDAQSSNSMEGAKANRQLECSTNNEDINHEPNLIFRRNANYKLDINGQGLIEGHSHTHVKSNDSDGETALEEQTNEHSQDGSYQTSQPSNFGSQLLNKLSEPQSPRSGVLDNESPIDSHLKKKFNASVKTTRMIISSRNNSLSNYPNVAFKSQHHSISPSASDSEHNEMTEKEKLLNLSKSLIDEDYQLSHNQNLGEATTQVLNTQEDVYNLSSLVVVDLGDKPVHSSSQDSHKRHHDLSVVSIGDDNSEVEDLTFIYEDSIFNQKKRKHLNQDLGTSQINECFNTYSLHDGMRDDLCHSQNSSVQESGSSRNKAQTLTDNTKNHKPFEGSPAITRADPLYVKFKENWSSSSSELEDISRDASEEFIINIGVIKNSTYKSEELLFGSVEDLSQEVRVTKRRRTNMVSDESTQSQDNILRHEHLNILDFEEIKNPDAIWVFSLFRNFPGKLVSFGEESSFVLRETCEEAEVRNSDLHILDVRVGDHVLVRLKFGQYVVTGLAVSLENLLKCIRGYDTVYITKKGKHGMAQGKEFRIALSEVCLEVDQLASHQQKFGILCGEMDLLQIPYSSVYQIVQSVALANGSDCAPSKANLLILQSPKKASGVFSGMFFFVTSIEGERKTQLSNLVTSNGGTFIDDEIDLILTRSESSDGNCVLSLKQLECFKFGALLSEGYSRSPKYLQALALGWPILADVFIDNVLQNPGLLEQWQAFLLPAGVSIYFNGAKSHEVFRFRNNILAGLNMSSQLSNNSKLMSTFNVLVLQDHQDPKVLNMCGFIFHAFGAKSIKLFENCSSIEKYIRTNKQGSFLVYDNNEHLFRKKHEKTKRKARNLANKVGVIDWEWVVQCVISNLIWKPLLEVQI